MPLENLIQRADLNQRLTRALEIKGQKSPVLQLDNSVMAVVIAEDLTQQAEWLTPTTRKLATSVGIPAVAAQSGILAVTNPAGSGVIAIVERVTMTGGGLCYFGLVDPVAVPAAPAGLYFRDRRNVGAPECRAFSGTDAIIRIVNQYLEIQTGVAVSTPWYEVEGIVIQPGDTFGIQAVNVNQLVQPTIWLEEIPLR
jgi:hypothetical protein